MSADEAGSPWRTDLDELETRLGHVFAQRSLLDNALTHSSYANEKANRKANERGDEGTRERPGPEAGDDEPVASNERLEFLGDAVIGLIVARQLYDAQPDWQEGDLTRGLHDLVDRTSLARAANRLELGGWLRLGRTELQSGGSRKRTILADAMEAVIGAVYLDGGLEPVVGLSRDLFGDALTAEAPRVARDPKTQLQESVMALRSVFPTYRLVDDNGIEGDDRRFSVVALVEGEEWGSGTARSKRDAERAAAVASLGRLAEETDDSEVNADAGEDTRVNEEKPPDE